MTTQRIKLTTCVFIACLASLWAQESRAQSQFFVIDSLDPGSLRADITLSNALPPATGDNIISWSAGSGGTITLATDLPTINPNTTLDVSGAPSAVTISGSSIPISGVVTFNNSTIAQPWTINSDIIGTGSLNQTGLGTLILTGINTYSGGTAVSSGTLNINSDAALGAAAGSLTLTNGATVQFAATVTSARSVILLGSQGGAFDTNGSTVAFTGVISGSTLTVQDSLGTGTLFLRGANTYSGGTFLNSGTLNLGNNAALGTGALTFNGGTLQAGLPALSVSNAITVNAGGGVLDDAGNQMTLSGIISGAGALTKISTGTVFLTGINTYSGGTNVNGGILNIANNSALGTGTVSMGGGALQFGTNGLDISNSIALAVAVSSVDTQGFNSTISGIISGAGLNKIGTGTLTLTGANTYSGGTIVNAGTLALGADNAAGTGDLTVNPGATFDMGAHTQTLAAFNANGGGGTLKLLVQPGATAPNLTVSGNATFTGSSLNAMITPQIVTNGETFNAIKYGANTGTFSSIASPATILFTPNYAGVCGGGPCLILTATVIGYSSLAVTPNQAAVARALEPFQFALTGDISTVVANLNTLNSSQLQQAFDQIGPIGLGALGGLGLEGYSVQSAAINRRMIALADGSAPSGYSTTSMNIKSRYPGDLLASAGTDESGNWQPLVWNVRPDSPWGFFTEGMASNGRLNEATSSAGVQPGYNFTTAGITAGADYRVSEHLAIGASAGYLHGTASIFSPASGSIGNQSARYGVYGAYFNEDFHANLYIGSALDFFKTSRSITFGSISRSATASPRGHEINVNPSVSYDIHARDKMIFTPFLGIDYDRLMINSFTESGADALDLSVGSETAQTLESSLGLRFSERMEWGSDAIIPFVSAGWRHEFDKQSRSIDAQLSTGGAAPFSIRTGNFAQNGTLIGAGISGVWHKDVSTKLEYTGDFRSHYKDNIANAFVRWKF